MMSRYEHNLTVAGDIPQSGSTEISLIQESLIQVMWRSRWLILLATLLAVLGAIIYLVKAIPIYTSTSRIYVEQSGPKIFTESEEGVMTQSKNYLYTQAELLKSTPIVTDALDSLSLGQMKTFNNVDSPVSYLKKNLNAVVGKKDDIISLSFDSPYPAEAAQIVNEVIDSYITYQTERKRSTSAEVLKILQTEKARRGQDLSEKLKAMVDYKREHESLAFETNQGNIVLARLERLSSVLTEAQLSVVEANSVYVTTKKMVSDPAMVRQYVETQRTKGIYDLKNSEKISLESKLDQLKLCLSDRQRQLKSSHPGVIALKTEIAHVEAQIADEDTNFAEANLAIAEQEYLAAKDKENQIAKYYEEQRNQALALNEQLAQFTILQSDWEQTKKLSDILDDRIKELNVTEDAGALNISILEVARPATSPSSPQKAKYVAIALVTGLMLGGGLALLRDWVDQRVRSTEEISAVLKLPVLGVVPSMSRRIDISARGQKVHQDSSSSEAEAYRTIRTAVFFSAPKNKARKILVTSPEAGDGKTTLASNLAITMAQAGQRTLIIDADFRRPMQQNIFKLNDKETGLSSILAGFMTSKDGIQHSGIEGLDLLLCGPHVPNPSELLNSNRFAELLEILADKYDRVIVDSPPVMPVTDSQIIAAMCDITLLVLRAGKSTRNISRQARDGLLSVGARVLGTVVNDVKKKGRYGYYSGYGSYHSHYAYGSEKKKKSLYRKALAVFRESENYTDSDIYL